MKSRCAYLGDACRHFNVGQGGTIIKSIVTDTCDAGREIDRRQRITLIKSTIPDARDSSGKFNTLQILTFVEHSIIHARDGGADLKVSQIFAAGQDVCAERRDRRRDNEIPYFRLIESLVADRRDRIRDHDLADIRLFKGALLDHLDGVGQFKAIDFILSVKRLLTDNGDRVTVQLGRNGHVHPHISGIAVAIRDLRGAVVEHFILKVARSHRAGRRRGKDRHAHQHRDGQQDR